MSKYLYGMHEAMPPDVMPRGWILFLAEVGHSNDEHPGMDFTPWADAGYGVICRIQHAWGDGGCLPLSDDIEGYLGRVETLTRNSRGCDKWVIGNEPNLPREWPNGVPLWPEYVGAVYNACRAIIDGEVILPPIGPWYVSNGVDWIEYFVRMINACSDIDAFALHTYSRGPDPASITSEAKMDPPYQHLYNGFRTYRDWMAAIPQEYRDRPAYITETDQNDAWLDKPNTWVQAAYSEIDDWNQDPDNQAIRALILYRWPKYDKYNIEGKTYVIEDFQLAQSHEYTWQREEKPPVAELHRDGFEDGFYNSGGVGELTCPMSWVPSWVQGTEEGILVRPEFKPAGAAQIRTGTGAAAIHSRYATIDGALVRPFSVVAGTTVTAAVWMLKTEDAGGHSMQIGIDPNGSIDITATSIAWSEWYSEHSEDYAGDYTQAAEKRWRERVTQVVATQSLVSVFLRSKLDNPVDGSNAHFDDLVIEGESGTVPPIEPPPTGSYTVVVYDPAGSVVVSCPFEMATIDPQVCTLAQQIVSLTCPGG